ncbi:ribokinase [Gracilibacillus alcaliphilus]|uniref:ribokinase n=1 Tax=Gracilibacillus alcaliphilus TaxID=1401441 RepID=UPI0019596377|nr:ribokinase [Gracilibacillus alcaliphilus]MBM7676840.1 ribokinase [Gracilibacillus alcaliphilus]
MKKLENKYDLIVYGSLNMDYVGYVDHLPEPGETVASNTFNIGPGGKAANQAVTASKLTAKTAMVGRVGDDHIGQVMKSELAQAGVDDDHVLISPGIQTGIAMVSVDQAGNNSIVTYKGANAVLKEEDVAHSLEKLKQAEGAVLQLEMDKQVGEYTIQMASRFRKKIILNLAPIVDLDSETLKLVDLLIVNEPESSFLSGIHVNSIDSAKEAAEIISKIGIDHIVITLGGAGAVFKTGDVVKHYPAPKVEVVDTTGAGDCFVGAVSFFWIRSGDLDAAVKHAVNVAALSVTKQGAITSLPSLEEYKQFIKEEELDFSKLNISENASQ